MTGLSWFGVEIISTPDAVFSSHAQPEPKRATPAALNFSLNASKLPKAPVMACATLPTGGPPAFGAMIFQNMEWLMWPPPLLRTAVGVVSGTKAQLFATNSLVAFPAEG